MSHPLYLAVSATKGLRQAATLLVLGRVRDALPAVGVTVDLKGNRLRVAFTVPRRYWWWLGAGHLYAWRRARRAARQALREMKTDVVLEEVRPWRRASDHPTLEQRQAYRERQQGRTSRLN